MTILLDTKGILKRTDLRIIDKIKSFLPEGDSYLKKHAPKFILYLLNCKKSISVLLKNSYYCAAIPSRFIQEHFDALYKSKKLAKLIELGIVKSSNYSWKNSLCREFGLNDELFLKLLLYAEELGICLKTNTTVKNPVTNTNVVPYDFATMSPSAVSTAIHSGNQVLLDIDSLIHNVVNYKYSDVIYISKLQEYCVERYKKILKKRKKLGYSKRYSSEIRSIASDYNRFVLLSQRGNTDSNGIFSYKRNFKITSTGRICEVNGGLQSLSRGCKSYIYKNLPDINNYDIRNCQLALLAHYAKDINIDTSWIDEYNINPDSKKNYSDSIGITIETWKKTILSVVFGSIKGPRGTPYNLILAEKRNLEMAKICYNKWLKQTQKLHEICKCWLTKVKSYAKQCSVNGVITNSVGVQLKINKKGLTSKYISAFFLQGLESRILCELVSYPTSDYSVVSAEYDGLVTKGQINQEVWTSIVCKLGLDSANLKLENKKIGS